MATKIKQKPKITKKSSAKAKSVGSERKSGGKTQHVTSHLNPTTPKKGGNKTSVSAKTNPMPIIEYPGERKSKGFPGVKTVGSKG